MDVFCVGMQRSGSTWQYNVVSHLVTRHCAGCRLGFVQGGQYAGLSPAGAAESWRVLKCHDGHPAFTAALAEGRARAVYSYRDLRDVVYSLAHVLCTTFEDVIERRNFLAVCRANDAFWTVQPGTVCQRYEEIFKEPAHGVTELAAHLHIPLADGEAEEVATEYSLRANASRTVEVANALRQQGLTLGAANTTLIHDEQTLLHWNHIREGRCGAWKDAVTPRQLALLVAGCTDWLIKRGYESTPEWWREFLQHSPATMEQVRSERIAAQDELIRTLRGLRVAHEQLARAQAHLARAGEALTRLEQLGPVALGWARRFHRLSLRYPRLSSIAKRFFRFWRGPAVEQVDPAISAPRRDVQFPAEPPATLSLPVPPSCRFTADLDRISPLR